MNNYEEVAMWGCSAVIGIIVASLVMLIGLIPVALVVKDGGH